MSFSEWLVDHTGGQTMLHLTCSMISSVDISRYGIFHAKDWVFEDCGTS